MDANQELQLIRSAKNDLHAFAQLYDHYFPIIYAYTLNRCANKELAEDVTSLAQIPGTTKVQWNVEGYSPSGFKVVWSLNENPEYPNRAGDKYQYFYDPARRESESLDAFSGPGNYFVRVCAHYNGDCIEDNYSNQIQITLE